MLESTRSLQTSAQTSQSFCAVSRFHRPSEYVEMAETGTIY